MPRKAKIDPSATRKPLEPFQYLSIAATAFVSVPTVKRWWLGKTIRGLSKLRIENAFKEHPELNDSLVELSTK